MLTRADVASLLDLDSCIVAVEDAFRAYAEGKALGPGVLSTHVEGGAFHIKAAGLPLNRAYYAAKVNGNFSNNKAEFGLPAIQGLIILCDARNGTPLAVMDSIEVTILRTGAATAVAAKHLARRDADTAMIWGCGNQGRIQLRSLAKVRPLKRVFAFDIDPQTADQFANELSRELGIQVLPTHHPLESTRQSAICVTCTPSRRALLGPDDITAGTFVAGVGADNPEKQELDPVLFRQCKVVVDILEQCAAIGDLHHAIELGVVAREDIHAELGDIVTGRKSGRVSEEEIILFDSTGTALQDAAAAAIVYEKALEKGKGINLDFQERS